MDRATATILTQTKSPGLAVVLALLFGGFGVFYGSVTGGVIMSIVSVIGWLIVFVTFGIGIILIPVIHLIAVIWAVVAVNSHNRQLVAGVAG